MAATLGSWAQSLYQIRPLFALGTEVVVPTLRRLIALSTWQATLRKVWESENLSTKPKRDTIEIDDSKCKGDIGWQRFNSYEY